MIDKRTIQREKSFEKMMEIFRDEGFLPLDAKPEYDGINLVDIYHAKELFHTRIRKCPDGSCFSIELFEMTYAGKLLHIVIVNTWKPKATMQTGMKFLCKEAEE